VAGGTGVPDSLRSVFASNLRAQCARSPSIAHVCRATGVNRQQFNKYLAGTYLPNERTRKALCDFFGISQEELFEPVSPKAALGQTSSHERMRYFAQMLKSGELGNISSLAGLRSSKLSSLQDGYYACYFPLQNYPEFLVRTALKVSSHNEVKVFTRHTVFVSGTFPAKPVHKSRHVGVVLGNENEFYLLGLNLTLPTQLSMLVFPSAQLAGSTVLAGTAMTRGTRDTHACRVCLSYLGNHFSSGKLAIGGIGVTSINESNLPPLVTSVMASQKKNPEAQLSPLSLESSFLSLILKNHQRLETLPRT
jgi:transcriptional regulator with XRE-family HTH domain